MEEIIRHDEWVIPIEYDTFMYSKLPRKSLSNWEYPSQNPAVEESNPFILGVCLRHYDNTRNCTRAILELQSLYPLLIVTIIIQEC